MRMGQHMKLAPRMIQSMEILQMPLAELEERIEQELENNPTLEIAEPSTGSDAGVPEGDARTDLGESAGGLERDGADADSFERLERYEESNPEAVENEFEERGPTREEPFEGLSRSRAEGESDAKSEAMAAAPARQAGVADQLKDQWGVAEVDESLRALGEFIKIGRAHV